MKKQPISDEGEDRWMANGVVRGSGYSSIDASPDKFRIRIQMRSHWDHNDIGNYIGVRLVRNKP